MRVIGYVYEADVHCGTCAYGAFGDALFDETTTTRRATRSAPSSAPIRTATSITVATASMRS
jgi:hypothetical protein